MKIKVFSWSLDSKVPRGIFPTQKLAELLPLRFFYQVIFAIFGGKNGQGQFFISLWPKMDSPQHFRYYTCAMHIWSKYTPHFSRKCLL